MFRNDEKFRSRRRIRKMLTLLIVVSLLFTAQPAWAASGETGEVPELTAESAKAFLDPFFASDLARSMYTGAVVTIVKDGEVLAKEGYGYADKEKETPADPDATVFRVASVSKSFTAVAIMQLAEQGKFSLDDDITLHLPGLDFINPFDKPVTISDLLLHKSGFAPSEPLPADMVTDLSIQVSMEDYARDRMPAVVREPGSAYMYDNYAYLLLGLIVQNASGQPYEQYMAEHVFAPLGMENSGFELTGNLLENLVTAYDPTGQPMEPYMYLPTIMPHGGMLSTAEDMAAFMAAFLNGGTLDSHQLLSGASVALMSEYQSAIHPLLPDTTYGFEAPMQIPQAGVNNRVIVKYGDLPGNSSMLLFIPDENVGVFLTYNQIGGLRDLFYQQFVATFFPELAQPVAAGEFEPADADQLARYAGLYNDLRQGGIVMQVNVAEADGQPQLLIHDGILGTRPLIQVDEHLFSDSMTMTLTAFLADEDGHVTYLREGNLNPLGYARKADEAAGFADVAADDPYAPYIHFWQSLGLYPNDADANFGPEEPVTRAELARDLMIISGLNQAVPRETYIFTDIASHELAPFIQLAAEMGMVVGDGKGQFHPDRPATRQDAAVMMWNVYRHLFPEAITNQVALTGDFAPWAEPAIRMMITFGLHGPEVAIDESGQADFQGRVPFVRREAAAFYHQLALTPVTQLAAQLMQQLEQAPTDAAELEQPDQADQAEDQSDLSDGQSGSTGDGDSSHNAA